MPMFKRHTAEMPGLNTSSLPDLIFTVLFFFMIVTHLRSVDLKVQFKQPEGRELSRLVRKTTSSYIVIGKPVNAKMANGANVAIQLNDKFASPADIEDFMAEEQKRLSPEDKQRMAVSLKADRNTPMSVITTVKQALRQANALNINYVADDENVNK